jgi:NAD(P)-dependent dehydrogenase (short-subunit alcohol dehydrogenase family)
MTNQKVALITGAGSGIGRASAIAFAKIGAKVIVIDLNPSGGNETVQKISSMGGEAIFMKADVSSVSQVKTLIQKVIRKYGRIDYAHNNAGIEGAISKTADCSEENWDKVIRTNLKSVWICMKYEIQQMVRRKYGVIINTSSVYGLVGSERGMPAYVASKHGIIGLTKTAALEYAKSGIRINTICAGPVNTSFRKRLISKSREDLTRYPLGRVAEPQEIANAVIWLCSDETSFVTGSTLVIDGGLTAR